MGKGGKGGQGAPQTTTTNTAPWAETQPYWKQMYGDIFGRDVQTGGGYWENTPDAPFWNQRYVAPTYEHQNGVYDNLMAGPNENITAGQNLIGQTYGNGPNADTATGWDMTRNAILDPAALGVIRGSVNTANDVLNQKFLDPNVNRAMAFNFQRGLENIGGQWDSTAVSAGRYGGDNWAIGRGQELADLQSGLYGKELDRIDRYAQMAPQIYSSAQAPGQAMTMLGQAQTGEATNRAQQMINLGKDIETRPFQVMGYAAPFLQGAGGGSSTQQAYNYNNSNPYMGALGGAAMGASFGGPWGAAAGGAIGYLSSK